MVDVERPAPGPGEVLVRVKAAGINPGEAAIRKGSCTSACRRRSRPARGATSPASSTSSAPGRTFAVGDEVIGWTDSARATPSSWSCPPISCVEARRACPGRRRVAVRRAARPPTRPSRGERVRRRHGRRVGGRRRRRARLPCSWRCAGASVIGLASAAIMSGCASTASFRWPTATASPNGSARPPADASTRSSTRSAAGYVALAIDELGVAPERVDTIIDWAAGRDTASKTEGTAAAGTAEVARRARGADRRRAGSRSRSPACPRSRMSATPTGSSSRGTRAARSCCGPKAPPIRRRRPAP